MDTFQGLSQKLNPLALKVTKQLTAVKQWGQERLGVAQDITELPQDYVDLEKRVDALTRLHTNLCKVTRTYQNPASDYPAHLQESIADFSRNVSGRMIASATAAASGNINGPEHGAAVHQPEAPPPPKTLSHALARACADGSIGMGVEEPLGAALLKTASVEDHIGDLRLKMDQEITNKFYSPFNATLNNTLAHASKVRKNVQLLRLNLDASKACYRSAKPERAEAARIEVEGAEDQFVAAVEEATTVMRACIQSPEPLKNISDLVAAQLTYFKEAHEALVNLAPELDEFSVTQDALYQNAQEQ